ncbi:hypothetical protein [Clostridium sp.]|uniref:hypothetical protein n=1 Tax=Clostridium sp. TaxID=1506 RepID=UPI002627B6F8|nr:hypothetical protein [Clostridium sp.]
MMNYKEEYENLVKENQRIDQQRRKLKSELKELNVRHSINELKIKEIKDQMSNEDSIRFKREFMIISKAILDKKTYSKLIYLTHEKINK